MLFRKTHEGKDDGIGHEPRAYAFEAEGRGRGHHGRGGEGSPLNIDCKNSLRPQAAGVIDRYHRPIDPTLRRLV